MPCVICRKDKGGTAHSWHSGGNPRTMVVCPGCARKFLGKKQEGPDSAAGQAPAPQSRGGFASDQVRSLRLGQAIVARLFSIPEAGSAGLASCPACKSTLDSILATGLASCPACYDHFRDFLDPLIRAYHGIRQPGAAIAPGQSLEEALRTALEHEEYEEAARLRILMESRGRKWPHGR